MKIPLKKILRWTGMVLVGAFVIIQFIRPTWNQREPNETPIEAKFPVPSNVQTILKRFISAEPPCPFQGQHSFN